MRNQTVQPIGFFKSIIRPFYSSVTTKFLLGLLFFIVSSFLLISFIYSWSTATLQDTNAISEEGILSAEISKGLLAYLYQNSESLAVVNSASIAPSSNKFDIGIIQSNNGVLTEYNFSQTRFAAFETFVRSVNSQTPTISYNPSTQSIYIVEQVPNGFNAGAIDATDANIKKLISSSNYYIALTDVNGNVFNSNSNNITKAILDNFKVNYNNYQQIKFGNFNREILTYSPIDNTNMGVAIMSYPIEQSIAVNIRNFFFYLTLLGIILFLAITVIYSLLVGIPLTSLSTFFTDYENGKEREINLHADDTFGNIAQNINILIKKVSGDFKRIEQEDQIQNDFLLLSGHILRTPLTSIQGYLDILVSQNPNLASSTYISKMQEALLELIGIVENILTISKGNDEIINAPIGSIVISEVMEEAFNSIKEVAAKKHINAILDNTNAANILINANKKNIVLAIKNLLDNAIKFTSEGGTVKLYALVKEKEIVLSVSDTGIGLTKEEIEQIFKKFSKISDTMEYNSEGFGIGLYVVKLISERYNGKVWVDSIKGSGSIFNIMLPIANA